MQDDERTTALLDTQARTLYVRNLNFTTDKETLAELFRNKLGRRALRSVTIARDAAKRRSAGYAFAEFATRDAALKAYRTLQDVDVDGHKLQLQLSGGAAASDAKADVGASSSKARTAKRRAKARALASTQPLKVRSEKLAIKNIAFEASARELRQLFAPFGAVKKLRAPKKFDGSLRGFAFVTFATKSAAQAAADALRHAHFYGRHLVVEDALE